MVGVSLDRCEPEILLEDGESGGRALISCVVDLALVEERVRLGERVAPPIPGS